MGLSLVASLSWSNWQVTSVTFGQTLFGAFGILAGAYGGFRLLSAFNLAKPSRWEHRAITVLILFLLFAPDTPWWGFPVVGVIAEVLQRVVRLPFGPVLNPAAAAAVLSGFFLSHFSVLPTWWGASFSPRWYIVPEGISVATMFVVPIGVWIAWKYKKLWTVGSVLFSTAVAYTILFAVSPAYLLLEGTLLFFALIMAVEPKTSPVLPKEQLVYGAGIGLLSVVLLRLSFVEAYAGALVCANAVYNGRRWYILTAQRKRAATLAK